MAAVAEQRLEALLRKSGGDMREAVRRFTGQTIKDLAADMGLSRPSVNHTLAGYPGRKNPPVRRSLEVRLGLPPYALDRLIK